MVSFGNLSAQAGEKSKGFLAVPGTDFTIPATLICGERPGKTVLVSGGVHSCEYVGIESGYPVWRRSLLRRKSAGRC